MTEMKENNENHLARVKSRNSKEAVKRVSEEDTEKERDEHILR